MINELKKYGTVLSNADLKKYNTYNISAKVKCLFFPMNVENLLEALKYLNENNIKYMVLGNGSNVIFVNTYYDGAMIKLDNLNNIDIKNNSVYADAGVLFPKLVMEVINHNLMGLEWACGIPGTVGGLVYGNAGAYKEEIFDYLKEITIIDENLEIKKIKKEDIKTSYRYTEFKDKYKDYIIIGALFILKNGNKEEALEIVNRRREKRIATQPLEYPSAGSVFRNPEGDSAGRIIEQKTGFKGKNINDAVVSTKHANFIINMGSATGKDIKTLIELIHNEVLKNTGIDLVLEQEYINWE